MVVLAGDQLVQVALERTHVGVDAHVVVVEDHQEVLGFQITRLIEALEGHPRGHGAVSDDGDAREVLFLQVPRHGHAQGGGDARAGVPGAEMVVDALISFLESREPMVLTEGVEAVLSPREDFVGIGLMTHIPDDAVLQEVEAVHEGHCQFHGTQVGAEVAPRLADRINEELPDLAGKLFKLSRGEVADLLGCRDRIQQWIRSTV